MALSVPLDSWSAYAYRHVPEGSSLEDSLDFRLAGRQANNRWNYPGDPTLYLAADPAVAIAEFARHMQENQTSSLAKQTKARQIYRLRIKIALILDLRDKGVLDRLSITEAPHCFLDKAFARATAQYIRTGSGAQGVLVPSVAFLDQSDRWVAVLFLDKLADDPHEFITSVEPYQIFHLGTMNAPMPLLTE